MTEIPPPAPSQPGPDQPYQQPFPTQPYAQGYPPPQVVVVSGPQRPTSTWAIISLIFGILGIVLGCCSFGVPSVVAVVCGHLALPETKDGAKGGHGMTIAGLVMGYLVAIPSVLFSIMVIVQGAFDQSS